MLYKKVISLMKADIKRRSEDQRALNARLKQAQRDGDPQAWKLQYQRAQDRYELRHLFIAYAKARLKSDEFIHRFDGSYPDEYDERRVNAFLDYYAELARIALEREESEDAVA